MRVNDAITGAIIFAAALVLFVVASGFPAMPGVPYGANVFPQAVCSVLMVAGVVLVVRGVREARATGRLVELDDWARRPRTWLNFTSVLAALVFYLLASERLGFVLTAGIILACMLVVLRGRDHLISSAVVSLVFPVVAYVAFRGWLRVPLPDGPLPGIF